LTAGDVLAVGLRGGNWRSRKLVIALDEQAVAVGRHRFGWRASASVRKLLAHGAMRR